ncbi:hypothetical protein [Arenibacter sp. ARW7G5Y1]|uniref:hypothetical protein n=1 Tax=Arenibacter sp. ARW7G5Y1 TaxID=2135619 RepID=UPI000D879683|nr:hypothetical protein [Arenibacter sp. ARW7G5Y1]PXX26327.1 hypothetical protein C7972_10922 [Arenibacter sp. ARW7G5Y1]|tara:strand:+ start:167 stop:475 length:309 start_codon:yes stop_codon:yes gene_type:complete
MKNSRLKNSISILFLALFLSMKMAGLHVLSHTDDKEHALHCYICDHAVSNNLTPAISADIPEYGIKNTESIPQLENSEHYDFVVSSTIATDQLFSRPPPSLL